ncbi:MAG: hypothetical protein ACR2H1_01220, partial [Limisphaerales bacterium]
MNYLLHLCARHFPLLTAVLMMVGPAGAAIIPVTTTADSLAGSLRQAIGPGSNPDDTIVFRIPTSEPGYDPATGVFTIT